MHREETKDAKREWTWGSKDLECGGELSQATGEGDGGIDGDATERQAWAGR